MCEDCPGTCRPDATAPLTVAGARFASSKDVRVPACPAVAVNEKHALWLSALRRVDVWKAVILIVIVDLKRLAAMRIESYWGTGTCEFTEAPTDCMAPRTISEGRYAGDLEMAPAQLESNCGGQPRSPETVFLYQPSMSGMVCVDTLGSRYDTVLYIRTGSCTGEGCSEIACNDDYNGVTSSLRFQAEAGQDYFIVVDSWSRGGPFTLNIQLCRDDMPVEPREPSMCQ